MKTLGHLYTHIFSRSKVFALLLVLSSSVYALFVIPMWLQKGYLEDVAAYLAGNATLAALLISLVVLYLARSITGGFLVPFGHAKDLYYEYAITRNVLLSQHRVNNEILLDYYEAAPVFNLMARARTALTSGALREAVNTVGSTLTLTMSLTAMISALYLLGPLFALISMVSIIPIFVEQLVFADRFFQLRRAIVEKRRRQDQCVKHIVAREYALETRVSGASEYFQQQWESYRQEIAGAEMKLHRGKLGFDLLLNLVKSVSVAAVIALGVVYMSQGTLTIGAFSAVVSILAGLHASTGYFITQISSLYAQWKELREVTDYYELERDDGSCGSLSTADTIRLEQVSYRYPGSEDFAVKGVSAQFRPGERVAILGANGAGKTTLVNLILGLYRPTSGVVSYGQQDLAAADKSALYSRMSAVFQDFGLYKLSIADNVRFGDLEATPTDDDICGALTQAGFSLEEYDNGANTFIGKEFNGAELSRGQAQQVAIARCYYNRRADIVVIDEPTAALDPIAEEKLYREFLGLAGNKTAFIISHRLGSVKVADRILVMDSGTIVKDGTHEELLVLNGIYAEMYRQQAGLYERESV